MKTFDFAYWIGSLAPTRPNEAPTDRFTVYADDMFTATVNGWVTVRERVKALGGKVNTTVGKISVTEI
jgi:hypothetical protein